MAWFKSLGLAVCVFLSACASSIEAQPKPAPVVLMGEVHDNPDAHAQRFSLIHQWVKQGWRPAVVMEQFDRDTQTQLDEALQLCQTAQCVYSQPWVQPWDWPLYEPLIQLAIDHHLPLLAANVSREDANAIVKGGYTAALDPKTIKQFNLNRPMATDMQQGHQEAIELGHCNMLPASVAENMVRAQVARDVLMAQVLINQFNQGRSVLLIAGNGHVGRVLGVPRWLPEPMLEKAVVYGFVELENNAQAEFDYAIQVKPHPRPDPCEAFKTLMK